MRFLWVPLWVPGETEGRSFLLHGITFKTLKTCFQSFSRTSFTIIFFCVFPHYKMKITSEGLIEINFAGDDFSAHVTGTKCLRTY